jgi:predicted enzyme related to lactoylglutathione lyase
MARLFDHIDLLVRSLVEVRPFHEVLLPALGFTRYASIPGWFTYEAAKTDAVREFFGVTESSSHMANECRVAFWVESRAEVDRLATIIRQAGVANIEGPLFEEAGYCAVFFEDPSGNRLEICHRNG